MAKFSFLYHSLIFLKTFYVTFIMRHYPYFPNDYDNPLEKGYDGYKCMIIKTLRQLYAAPPPQIRLG
jgi:hypothetical protein